MGYFEVYQFILCLIVFVLLTGIFTTLTVWIIKLHIQLIVSGVNDEKIKEDYIKQQKKKLSVVGKIIDKAFLALFSAIMIVLFVFSAFVSLNDGNIAKNIPSINVVKSNSMSYINENHGRLDVGAVDDQIQMFDLVFIAPLPKEDDLKINDIVVYETDNISVIHRIVAIEDRNDVHPNERWFLLQGDANETTDRYPVRYTQMQGIYKGSRVPYIGSFVVFLQSPAGYLCILLIVFALIATPIAEKRIKREIDKRLLLLKLIANEIPVENIPVEEDSFGKETEIASAVASGEPPTSDYEEPIEDSSEELPLPMYEEPAVTSIAEFAVPSEEEVLDVLEEERSVNFKGFGKGKTFAEKLEAATEPLLSRYDGVTSFLRNVKKVRKIRGRKFETYRSGNVGICRLSIRGKTLNVYLALNPADFENTKYIYEDVSHKTAYRNYAMRVKVTSTRQVKWVNELIALLAKQNDLKIVGE